MNLKGGQKDAYLISFNVKEKYMFLSVIQLCVNCDKVCLDWDEPPKSSSEHGMVKLYVCTEWSYLNHN